MTATYEVVDPDVLFQLLPGSPRRPMQSPHDAKYFDKYGYLIAGDTRASVTLSSRRAATDNPYDVDLTFRILVSSSDSTSAKIFAQEWEQAQRFASSMHLLDTMVAPRAEEARIWRSSMMPGSADCVALVRYGNYVLGYVGRIENGGYFETEAQFIEMVSALDSKIPAVLKAKK